MGRPRSLERFVKAYIETSATLPIYVVFDLLDAHRYDEIITPPHWRRCSVPIGTRLGDIFNLIFKHFPAEDFYGMVADDVVPETPQWDVILREACLPNKISWGWDGIQNEKLPVHPFIGGDLVRQLGFWAPPGIKHWYVDNAWKAIAEKLEVQAYLPNVKMTHHHYVNGKARMDRTYESQPSTVADRTAFINYLNSESFQKLECSLPLPKDPTPLEV